MRFSPEGIVDGIQQSAGAFRKLGSNAIELFVEPAPYVERITSEAESRRVAANSAISGLVERVQQYTPDQLTGT